jgi:hypothetical protein
MATYLSPTDTEFYDSHETSILFDLFERIIGEGATIAMNHGADHPQAVERLKMAGAIAEQVDRRLTATAAQ